MGLSTPVPTGVGLWRLVGVLAKEWFIIIRTNGTRRDVPAEYIPPLQAEAACDSWRLPTPDLKHALITQDTLASHTERNTQSRARRERGATISVSQRQRPAHEQELSIRSVFSPSQRISETCTECCISSLGGQCSVRPSRAIRQPPGPQTTPQTPQGPPWSVSLGFVGG